MNGLINKSVKSIGNGLNNIVSYLNQDGSKVEVEFCKFDTLKLNYLKRQSDAVANTNPSSNPGMNINTHSLNNCFQLLEQEQSHYNKEYNVFYFVHNNSQVNIYYISDKLELKCILTEKFDFHIDSIERFNSEKSKDIFKEQPMIVLVSNSTKDHFLSFYSLKSKKEVHRISFKKRILQFISKGNRFSVMLASFKIKIFSSEDMGELLSINTSNLNKEEAIVKSNELVGMQNLFDMSDIYVLYQELNLSGEILVKRVESNDLEVKEKILKRNEKNAVSNAPDNSVPKSMTQSFTKTVNNVEKLEYYTKEAYKNIHEFGEWSYKKITDLNNLFEANAIKNNLALKRLNQSTRVSYLNLKRIDNLKDCDSSESNTSVMVPYIKDQISYIKFYHGNKYFIVGNSSSQIFYIYEVYPETSLKYESNTLKWKILYSIYRGVTSATINCIEWSSCKNFIIISSSKGTFHLFYLPKLEKELLENTKGFNYDSFNEVYLNITQAIPLDKIKLGNYLGKGVYKTSCKILSFINLDYEYLNLPLDKIENLKRNMFDKSLTGNIVVSFCDSDIRIHPSFIKYESKVIEEESKLLSKRQDKNKDSLKNRIKFYPLNKIGITVTEEKKTNESVEANFIELTKPFKNTFAFEKKRTQFLLEQIESVTTSTNLPQFHLNPNFSINILKTTKGKKNVDGLMKPGRFPSNASNNGSSKQIPLLMKNNSKSSFRNSINVCNSFQTLNQSKGPGVYKKIASEKDIIQIGAGALSQRSLNNQLDTSKEKDVPFVKAYNSDSLRVDCIISFTLSAELRQQDKTHLKKKSLDSRNSPKLTSQRLSVGGGGGGANSHRKSEVKDNNSDSSYIEKILYQEIEYSPKIFSKELRVNMRTDALNEVGFVAQGNIVLNPKLLGPSSNNLSKGKKRSRILSSDNYKDSIAIFGETRLSGGASLFSNFEAENDNYMKNKDQYLKMQIEHSLSTDICVNLKPKPTEIKVLNANFTIVEDFLLK